MFEYLLLETGDFVLLVDGASKIILAESSLTTAPPTTAPPTTIAPTTLTPTTVLPTTLAPTTPSPTTLAPTTLTPTTLVPTTSLPTTAAPTVPPTTPIPIEVGWTADKDLGPWAFTEQKDKWGYLNNKRWSDQPAAVAFSTSKGNESDRTDKHVPCGHWHKGSGSAYNQLYGAGSTDRGQLARFPTGSDYVLFFLIDPMTGWKMVTCGGWSTLAVKLDGTIWSTGTNAYGQLGLGHSNWTDDLTQVLGSNWDTVEGGRWHTLALQLDGSIWACGSNGDGQLGIPAVAFSVYTFTQIGVSTDWTAINTKSGSMSSAALKGGGTLWTWGRNNFGQLGQGDLIERDVPTQVGADTNWTDVDVGESHMLALKSNGTLWSTGLNVSGALGQGDHGPGTDRNVLTQVGVETNWAKIYAGEYYSYAMKSNGTIWATGDNDDGQLGQGDNNNLDVFTQVGSLAWDFLACGQSGAHVFAIDEDKNLYSVGRNDRGQLGLGNQTNTESLGAVNLSNITGAAGGFDHSVVIKESTDGGATDEPQVWNLP